MKKITEANEERIQGVKSKIYDDNRIGPFITKEELCKVDTEFQNMSLKDKKSIIFTSG